MNSAVEVVRQGRLAGTLTALRHGVRVHAVLYFFALTVCTLAVLESLWLGLPLDFEMVMIFTGPVLLILLVMIFIGLAKEMARLHRAGYQGSVIAALGVKLREDYL